MAIQNFKLSIKNIPEETVVAVLLMCVLPFDQTCRKKHFSSTYRTVVQDLLHHDDTMQAKLTEELCLSQGQLQTLPRLEDMQPLCVTHLRGA